CLELLVGDLDILALADLIALDDGLAVDLAPALLVYLAVADAVSGFAVDLVEADLVAFRRGGIKRDRTRHQRQLEIALPIRTRGHARTPTLQNPPRLNAMSEAAFRLQK